MSDQSTAPRERPLSPHLQVYKLPYNANMSIIGRGVGVALSAVVSALLIWFVAVVWNPAIYDQTITFLDILPTRYLLLLLAFVVFFYLGNGIRHVFAEMVIGVTPRMGVISGNIVLLVSALLTLGLWAVTKQGGYTISFEDTTVLAAQQTQDGGETDGR